MIHHDEINYGDTVIKYELSFQERKSLGIKVFPDGSVHVAAPSDISFGKIEEKLKAKAPWILKQQREFLSFHPLTPHRAICKRGNTFIPGPPVQAPVGNRNQE